ncbi:MAG: haloacid dehalogenase type II [Chloroflexota bacterium]|nr:haloacid dehalogenase type II [Chloroflexota bacterium]MDE2958764.1 haloacid dehalogenase type II [Chloroflexota bacterium]
MADFIDIEWLSFDCYGTLVDWETGISSAVSGSLESYGVRKTGAEILELFADVEPVVQSSGAFKEYHVVLREVMTLIGDRLGIRIAEDDVDCLSGSLPRWPVFPDTGPALQALKQRYKLAIISNVDDDLFAGSARALGVEFDAVITSQQARAYKPNSRSFELAEVAMGVGKDRWLHVGESLFHDIEPANRLGIRSVWVNRVDRGGGTRPTNATPDLTVPDLAALAEILVPA